MHKIIIKCFQLLKDIAYFFKIAGLFYAMTMALYWIQNIISANWNWLNFLKPSLEYILSISANFVPATVNMLDIQIEVKYAAAIFFIFVWTLLFHYACKGIESAQDKYEDVYAFNKKKTEEVFNKNLKKVVIDEEKRIKEYSILIKTKLKKKFLHQELNINIEDFNKQANDFIEKKTGIKHAIFQSGFLYTFDNFEKIDDVLDVLFKMTEKDLPVEFSIVIQAGDKIDQLAKIASFDLYGKIVFAADTLLRYKVNRTHRYQCGNIGIFKYEDHSLELHEFKRID